MESEKFKTLKFTDWCIRNRTAVYVMTLLLALAGYVSFVNIPKENFPSIIVPTISVVTIYPGATPEDVENLITKPIEKQLKSINGVKKITSNSISDVSIITVEFNTNVQVQEAKIKVSDAVDKSKNELPTDLDEDPQVQEFDFSEFPIMNVNVAGTLPLDKLKKYAEDLEEAIETLPEITRVDIVGGLEREIQINVDLYKMQSAGISFSDIEGAVARENVNISSGELRVGELRRNLRVTGQFKSPGQIGDIVVRSIRGNEVFLREIAEVVDGFEEKQDFARLNNKSVISLNVIKRSGENLINAADKIGEIIHEYETSKFPEGVTVQVTNDQSIMTKTNLNELFNTVIIGFILVLIVLMFFMGLKSAFFVALAGPLSALVAFLVMPGMDFTLNLIVLFSFLLALGIIVDDAIVVIENTHRIFHKYHVPIEQAARWGAGEVFIPVLAGTLTTLGPFVPLLFWPGIVGKFFIYLPVTLIITLGASLLVAFVINPVFAVSFMKKDEHKARPKLKNTLIWAGIALAFGLLCFLPGWNGIGNFSILMSVLIVLNHFVFIRAVHGFQEKLWPKFINVYKRLVTSLTKGARPVVVVILSFVILVISLVIYGMFGAGTSFFPQGDPNNIEIYCQLPQGTDAHVTDSVTRIIERKIYNVVGENNPNVESVVTNIGLGAGDPMNPDRVPTPHKSKVTVAFVKFAERHNINTKKVMEDIRDQFKEGIAGATITVQQEQNGPPTGKPINVEISGDEFSMLKNLEEEFLLRVAEANVQGIEELKSDLQLNKPELIIEIDKEKMQREGLTLAQVGMDLRTALFGKEVSKFRDDDDDAPIMVRLDSTYRKRADDLLNVDMAFLDMATGQFRQVPISSIATIRKSEAFSSINRKNQNRVVTLSSNVLVGFNENEVAAGVQDVITEMKRKLPEGYDIKLTGAQEEQAETANFLGVAFLAALALMFLIMVIQFNSTIKPLMIFTTVLFSLIGVFLGFTIFGMEFSIAMSGIGIFALAGIVIRNGILLIEFTDELRQRGMEAREAVIEAGATRVTPVILTAVSAILGLIPLGIGFNINFGTLLTHLDPHIHFGGDNVVFWGPLAWTIIFGLIVATFLTLLVVPSMYLMGYNFKYKVLKRKKKTVETPEV